MISFVGNVKIETRDKLEVFTEALADINTENAQTDSPVTFERENVSGKSTGAVLEKKRKHLN